MSQFKKTADSLCLQLEAQQKQVQNRLLHDETLDYIANLFSISTGQPFTDEELKKIATEGQSRYQKAIPPGYKDGKKDSATDEYKKFGDLIVWKQIIEKAKVDKKPLIFITDDLKEDWWASQSGKTIGPRPELIEEFLSETGQSFWMYSVDKFLEETAKLHNTKLRQDVIKEILEVREDLLAQLENNSATEVLRRLSRQNRKPNPEFMKSFTLSDELALIVGSKSMSRLDITSKLWAYIRANRLHDETNPTIVNTDDKLFAIFGKRRVSISEFGGLVGKHLKRNLFV